MPVTMGLIKRTIVYFTTALTAVGQTTYTVPAGVFSLTVKCWGAGGGGAGSADGDGGCGGSGGFAQATITVTPGETLTIYVGAGGGASPGGAASSGSGGGAGGGLTGVLRGTTPLVIGGSGGTKGLVPAPAAGDAALGKFLKADGTWAAPSGGGGSGDVAGPASATDNAIARFDTATGKLIQNSPVLLPDGGEITLPYVASPAAPAADKLNLFAGRKANRMLPRFIGPSGLDVTLQPLVGSNKIAWWNPPGNATTVPGVLGIAAPTAVGTATARNVAATNLATRARRLGYVSAATAGSLSGHYSATAQFTIGATGGIGGFFYVCRFIVSDAAAVSGARMFVGLRNAVAAPANVEPSSGQTNMVGAAQISTSNNLQIVYGGSAAQTAIDLGASFPANTLSADLYELALFAPPDTQVISYQVTRVNTGDIATGTLSGAVGTVIPAAATFLAHAAWRCNNATALAVGIDVVSLYIETDN